MGNKLNSFLVSPTPREYRIVYLQDLNGKFVAIEWPDTFSELILLLRTLFKYTPIRNMLNVTDGAYENIIICSEETFSGLVPRHKRLEPDIDVFYIGIDIPISLC